MVMRFCCRPQMPGREAEDFAQRDRQLFAQHKAEALLMGSVFLRVAR